MRPLSPDSVGLSRAVQETIEQFSSLLARDLVSPQEPAGFVVHGGRTFVVRWSASGPQISLAHCATIGRHASQERGVRRPMSDDIVLHDEDGVTLAMFARAYVDDRGAKAAWERARQKIAPRDNTSVFRVQRPDQQQIIVVVSQSAELARRVRERVAWGGLPCDLSADEIQAMATRMREVSDAGGLRSTTRWGNVGGIGLEPEGSTGPRRRPQG